MSIIALSFADVWVTWYPVIIIYLSHFLFWDANQKVIWCFVSISLFSRFPPAKYAPIKKLSLLFFLVSFLTLTSRLFFNSQSNLQFLRPCCAKFTFSLWELLMPWYSTDTSFLGIQWGTWLTHWLKHLLCTIFWECWEIHRWVCLISWSHVTYITQNKMKTCAICYRTTQPNRIATSYWLLSIWNVAGSNWNLLKI